MDSKLLIGNLSLEVEESMLRELFSQFGPVRSVEIVIDPHTGRRKGFAFVEMSSAANAQKALQLDGTDLGGRPINVNACQESPRPRSLIAKIFNLLHA